MMALSWDAHWGGAYRKKYTSGPYLIRWVGSTHGVWQLLHNGQDGPGLGAAGSLKMAKEMAEAHYERETKDGMDRG